MRGIALLCLSVCLVLVSLLLLGLNGCSGASTAGAGTINPGKIEHIVVIFQENRTPDNLFHDPVLMSRGADIASNGLNSLGQSVPLTPTSLGIDYDLSHSHSSFVAMYDGGKMDGADLVPIQCYASPCPPPNPQFYYVQASDVGPYFQMAEQYTFGDRMFQTNEGPSFPAHQFIISGTSAPSAASNMFASENTHGGTGCAAAPGATVLLIDPSGNETSTSYPCFEHPTLTDELDAKGLSWRYYTINATSIWSGPNAIQHICQPQTQNGQLVCTGKDWGNVIIPPQQVLTDIAGNQLAAVTWVIPTGPNSDHAGSTAAIGGPSWVASIVNAIGNSQFWSNTAILVTWDDWGGWYDHVPPPQVIADGTSWGSGYVYGFRIPLIVISPYAKAAYVSHVNHDFGSILRFIEETFGVASLGYADARADNLADCFDFTQTPLPFHTIQAPMSADSFIHDKRPLEEPDND